MFSQTQAAHTFTLTGNAVHVWTFPLRAADAACARFAQILAHEERERAARFQFHHLRESFVIAHGALRSLLSRYLQLDPVGIVFEYHAKGKPHLPAAPHLQFSISHSGGLALVALTTGCELGVDVEHVRPLPDLPQIAERFFCAEETHEILRLPNDEREGAFYRCWTRKEAYVKAVGEGLSVPLDSFRVSVGAGQPARMLHLNSDTAAAGAWTLHDLRIADEYAAALAYRDMPRPLTVFPIVEPMDWLVP